MGFQQAEAPNPDAWFPSDQGFAAWAYDPATITTGSATTSGVLFCVRLLIRAMAAVSTLWANVNTAAVTPTANQNFLGLYQIAGGNANLLAGTAPGAIDGLITGGGPLSAPITPQLLIPGQYLVAMLFNAATPPVMARTSSASAGNTNLAGVNMRFFSFGAAQTALPNNFALAGIGQNANYWAAIS